MPKGVAKPAGCIQILIL